MANLQVDIEKLYAAGSLTGDDAASARQTFTAFREALTAGSIRAAEKRDGEWRVNAWVKKGILLGFRLGELQEMGGAGPLSFVDKSTFPARRFETKDNVRVEPVNASPVIIEDDVLVGGNCGVYEGTQVRSGAVLGAGTILTRATPVYDIVREQVYRSTPESPLVVPENAVVVPGSRAVTKGKAAEWGLSLYTPVIVKYRDEKTQSSIELEDLLR
jgi:tape measure domain-containing protein